MFKQRTHPPAARWPARCWPWAPSWGRWGSARPYWAGNIDPMNKFAWGTNITDAG